MKNTVRMTGIPTVRTSGAFGFRDPAADARGRFS